jgi:hypothetical protein
LPEIGAGGGGGGGSGVGVGNEDKVGYRLGNGYGTRLGYVCVAEKRMSGNVKSDLLHSSSSRDCSITEAYWCEVSVSNGPKPLTISNGPKPLTMIGDMSSEDCSNSEACEISSDWVEVEYG